MYKVILNKNIKNRIYLGHLWIYKNEIDKVEGNPAAGAIVDVFNFQHTFIGRGYYNPASLITIRLLTHKKENIDALFFLQRIQEAYQYRLKLGFKKNMRLVFGEADYLPALIIDKFGDYFVIQTLSLGMDIWLPEIVDTINTIFKPAGIYERNDVPVRTLENLPLKKGFLSAPFNTEILIEENGVRFLVDIDKGQKTGYFLDQKDNRASIQHIVKNASVLGAFCYTGSFEICAANYGAKSVLGIDISDWAIECAQNNARLNKLDSICTFEQHNAFDVLKLWANQNKKFDVVMLDPPAFTKSRTNIQNAITGYKEINLRGMKLIHNGGFLVSSSCTNLVSPDLFLQTIELAAKDAKKSIRQVVYNTQSSDHPIIYGIDNTQYLKFIIVEVKDKF